jgi:heme-degrading monooxygenase HmoA
MPAFTFINAFEIPEGKEDIFRNEWPEVVERLKDAQGLLSVRLYEVDSEVEEHLLQVPGLAARLQERPNAKARFHFIVVAEWADISYYKAVVHSSHQERSQEKPLLAFPSHPGYYRIASEYTRTMKTL